jgi:parallel beta-helix repeat protein
MRVQRFLELACVPACGFALVMTLIWLAGTQAARVNAGVADGHSGVVLYVSNNGEDAGNLCQDSSSPCQTIQRAILVAEAGDYIHMAGGEYTGSMFDPGISMGISATVIITKDISSLLGGYSQDFSTRDPITYETVLSAADTPGGYVAVLVGTNVRLGGFTLTGGSGAYSPGGFHYPGGAVRIFDGSPTISDNVINNNKAFRRGGGIYIGRGATPSILNNRIVSNTVLTVEGDATSAGGGIYIASGPTLISNNTILSNTAESEGGAIYIGWNVPVEIISNTIAYNRLSDQSSGHGAGIHTNGETEVALISGNLIHHNSLGSGFEGSGLYISSPAMIEGNWIEANQGLDGRSALFIMDVSNPVTVTNNVIVENSGIGVRLIENGDVRLINNTIAGNDFRGVQVQFVQTNQPGQAAFTLHNNIVANNGECGVFIENNGSQDMDYNDVSGQRYQYCGFPSIQAHSLSQDPAFVDPTLSDYQLSARSPAIDSGDGSIAPVMDYAGNVRSQNYTVDIGAYEFVYYRALLPLVRR